LLRVRGAERGPRAQARAGGRLPRQQDLRDQERHRSHDRREALRAAAGRAAVIHCRRAHGRGLPRAVVRVHPTSHRPRHRGARGLTWPQAMAIVFLEGGVITLLVLPRFRQAMLDAVPLGLKRAISVGIGLFIAFIGLFTAGFVVKPDQSPLPVGLGRFDTLPAVVFVLGFVLTAWLMARRVRGALLIGILGSTALAIVLNGAVGGWQGFPTPGAATLPRALVQAPDFSTFGRLAFGAIARLGVVTAVLVTFSIMLSDFFDTVGTIIGVGGK